ncbi:MAG: hypothetical protein A3F17_03180 [Gammaproteobacteria bacterium RIFCSPHIGHO2_12_FULL_41_15]|nr:MAG: hypothetical protein A3F17_03180 [Gammaproteobacteria bacterium RIFCSPHIGHO2_12_FULL_41_15]
MENQSTTEQAMSLVPMRLKKFLTLCKFGPYQRAAQTTCAYYSTHESRFLFFFHQLAIVQQTVAVFLIQPFQPALKRLSTFYRLKNQRALTAL